MTRHAMLLLAFVATACDHEPRTEYVPEAGIALAEDESESDGAAAEAEDEDEDDAELDHARFDLPPQTDVSCTKIDFLFVIDDSGSMKDEQARLIDGFPGFVAGVQEEIAKYDYHMMVVTPGYSLLPSQGASCDGAIGSGRIATPDGESCGFSDSGRRYATAEDDDLADIFSCVGDVGLYGNGDERPMWAMLQALTAETLPGGCNEGFLRDDAILVVTIITDEEDDAGIDSPGNPADWKEVLLAAKEGAESDIVMLGLLGDADLEDGGCKSFEDGGGGGAEGAPRLRELVDSFEYGSWSSVCADDYAPFFTAAVDDIGQACFDFVPVG